jgi:opacity protein-like surface antigen
MKRILFAALLLGTSIPAFAQEPDMSPTPYAEIGVGLDIVPDVSTQTYTFTSGANTGTGKINLNYDTGFAAAAELGYAGLGIPQLRLGIGYDYLEGTFRSGQIVGTVNGAPGSLSFTRNNIASLGSSLDNDINLVSGNLYYSLPMVGPIRPYIGGGAGVAFITNAGSNFAASATAGFRMAITDEAYFGVRYRYYWVNSPTDDGGIHYEDVTAHSVMAILGMYLD